jgi:hypothetical protein
LWGFREFFGNNYSENPAEREAVSYLYSSRNQAVFDSFIKMGGG